jgi:hypothetical protein
MNTKKLLAFVVLIISGSWATPQKNTIEDAAWLIGTWENKTQRGSLYEQWTKISDLDFAGKSYMLQDKDTIVFETIRMVQEPNGLAYIPTVKKQNNALPVRFTLKTISAETLVFENREHDFPQIISYTKVSKDSLVAEISGVKNGQDRKQRFSMKRVN